MLSKFREGGLHKQDKIDDWEQRGWEQVPLEPLDVSNLNAESQCMLRPAFFY